MKLKTIQIDYRVNWGPNKSMVRHMIVYINP